jgi:hypothetical protein
MDASVLAAIIVVVGAAVFVWWVLVLIEALRTPTSQWAAAGQNQIIYIALMVLLGIIGTIVYIAVARPQLRTAGSSTAA